MNSVKTGGERIQGPGRRQTMLAGLAADDYGSPDRRPPLVLLHGLTFDRSLWRPALAELSAIDPGRRVLLLDLPGHGQSADWPSYDLERVVEGVHLAIEEAQLQSPVVVGHSISAVIATLYAARHPSRGVVNVDQLLQAAPFAALVQSLAGRLRGPAFPAVWEMFDAGMHVDALPESAQVLIRSAGHPRADVVLGYWSLLLERPVSEIAAFAAAMLAAVRTAGLPYLVIAGDALEPEYEGWLKEAIPQVSVTVLPASGHFPHLAHPALFAQCLAATGGWEVDSSLQDSRAGRRSEMGSRL